MSYSKIESLEDKVKHYKELCTSNAAKSKREFAFGELENDLLLLAYFVPQNKFGLKEEDASAFLLFIKDHFRHLVDKFNPELGSFINYYYGALKIKVTAFYSQKFSEIKREKLYIQNIAPQEHYYKYYHTDNSALCVAENTGFDFNSTLIRKLRFMMKNSITCRKRSFAYLLSIGPFADINFISNYCTALKIDRDSTLEILKHLEKKCSGFFVQRNKIESARNYYLGKIIESQEDLIECASEGKNTDRINESIDNLRKRMEFKNNDLKNFSEHIPYSVLADLLNLNEHSIASMIFYFRLAVRICNGDDSGLETKNIASLGLNKQIAGGLLSGRWTCECVDESLSVFYPYLHFTMNFPH